MNAITPNSNNEPTAVPADIAQAIAPEGIGTPVHEGGADATVASEPVAAPKRKRTAKAPTAEKKNARTKKAKGGKGKGVEQKAEKPVKAPKAPREKAKKPAELLAELAPEEKEELEAIRSEYTSIGRKDAEQVFAIGDLIRRAEAIVPAGTLGTWVEAGLGISARQGRNYSAVAEKLAPWRKRVTAQGVHPSTLYAMASAVPEKVEAVVAAYEAGERPKHKDIAKALAAPKPEKAEVDPANVGGPAGLKTLAAAKSATGIRSFVDGVAFVAGAIEAALKTAGAKRVEKKALGEAIEMPARRCKGELPNLALFVRPTERGQTGDAVALEFPEGSGWRTVAAVLALLSKCDKWPPLPEFGPWLRDIALPALKWAAGTEGGSVPARQASADPIKAADEPVAADEPIEEVDGVSREDDETEGAADEAIASVRGPDDTNDDEEHEASASHDLPEALPVAAIAHKFARLRVPGKRPLPLIDAPNSAPGVS